MQRTKCGSASSMALRSDCRSLLKTDPRVGTAAFACPGPVLFGDEGSCEMRMSVKRDLIHRQKRPNT